MGAQIEHQEVLIILFYNVKQKISLHLGQLRGCRTINFNMCHIYIISKQGQIQNYLKRAQEIWCDVRLYHENFTLQR